MSTDHNGKPPPYAERDLLSVIDILQTLLARPGRSDDSRARWRGRLKWARTQLESLRTGDDTGAARASDLAEVRSK